MTPQELKSRFTSLYSYMASSKNPAYMMAFGSVMKEMMDWMTANKPAEAQEWIDKLESIRWNNYLTPKEAETIVAQMMPKAPWTREQWKAAMDKHKFMHEEMPYYNPCALFVTMSMIYSDSSETLSNFMQGADMFDLIHGLAIDKLKDQDGRFNVRHYFGLQ